MGLRRLVPPYEAGFNTIRMRHEPEGRTMAPLQLLRWLLRVPLPVIDRNEAIRIALAEGERLQLDRSSPEAIEGLRRWSVWLHPNFKGSPIIEICNRTGAVLAVRTLPR